MSYDSHLLKNAINENLVSIKGNGYTETSG